MAPLKKVESLYIKAQRTLIQTLYHTNNNEDWSQYDNHSDDSLKHYFDCIPSAISDDVLNLFLEDKNFVESKGQHIALAFSNASSKSVTFTGFFGENLGTWSSLYCILTSFKIFMDHLLLSLTICNQIRS